MRPEDHLAAVVEAHRRLVASVRSLTDAQARGPSRLPGWSRGHLVTHLARNADAFTWVAGGVEAGEVRPMYPREGMREADIEAGSGRPATELAADLGEAAARLVTTWTALPEQAWDHQALLRSGSVALGDTPFLRLREVEVHHVDLDVGYQPSAWTPTYAAGEVARQLPGLAERAPAAELVAWLLGRGPAPTLDGW